MNDDYSPITDEAIHAFLADDIHWPEGATTVRPRNGNHDQADTGSKDNTVTGETLDDIGNSNRLLALHGDRFRYLTDVGVWRIWDGQRWDLDQHNRIQEAAKDVAQRMLDEELRQQMDADSSQPRPPAGYPNALVGPLHKWLEDDPAAAMSWLGEDPARLAWAGQWLEWKRNNAHANALEKFAHKTRDMPRINAMIRAASSIPDIATTSGDYDRAGVGLINLLNGTLDTQTVTLRPHRRRDMLTKVAPLSYNPHAQAPLWQRFLEDNLPEADTRRYVQKLAGYALTGRANEKMMAYLYGPSDTGKSLFAAVLLAMLGDDYGMAAAKGTLAPRGRGDDGRDPDRHDMAGARLVVTSESRPGEPMDEALVKALTGRDTQRSRGNYARGNESWTPEMLLMVCSNQLPRITGDDDAIWTRIHVVPFKIQFLAGDPRRDDNLQKKIVDGELEGVLAWAVDGLRMYHQEGLKPPQEVRAATDQFRSDSDGVARFLAESAEDGSLLLGENEWAVRKDLYAAYDSWCKEAGVKHPLVRDRFFTRMDHLGYPVKVRKGQRGFAGVTVTRPASGWVAGGNAF